MIFQQFVNNNDANRKLNTSYKGIDKMVIFGESGKSSICASLTEITGNNGLAISPAGTSRFLETVYPKFLSYQVNNIEETEKIIDDIIAETSDIEKIRVDILSKNLSRIELAKKKYGDMYPKMEAYAGGKEKYPLSFVVLEEANLISSWIEEKTAKKLGQVAVGSTNDIGFSYRVFRDDMLEFYGKLLRLPMTVIIATSRIMPKEKQGLEMVIPDISGGVTQRIIIDLVGNVFYSTKTADGKHKVVLNGKSQPVPVLTKEKLLLPASKQIIPNEIDVTGNPRLFWDTLSKLKEIK